MSDYCTKGTGIRGGVMKEFTLEEIMSDYCTKGTGIRGGVMKEFTLEEDKLKSIIKDAFNAGSAWTIGCHKDFKQIHPDSDQVANNYIKDLKEE